jgi:FkbM family methyltransferase
MNTKTLTRAFKNLTKVLSVLARFDAKALAKALLEIAQLQQQFESNFAILFEETSFLRRRLSTYLGNGRAITYLDDEIPIYVNSNDFGPPANFINGGVYEQENLDVLMSFLRDDTIFLDIGANLGFFSLKIGSRIRQFGQVHAFEPHPELATLLRGSAFLNGLGNLRGEGKPISVHQLALGDVNEETRFGFPRSHLGGGAQVAHDNCEPGTVAASVRRLDDLFPEDFIFDLAKIDVEGHELQVIRGMRNIITRSPRPKILFEKLGTDHGYEYEIENELNDLHLRIYHVLAGAKLREVARGQLKSCDGYFLACHADELKGEIDRACFKIYPRQFFAPAASNTKIEVGRLTSDASEASILFHGPYWHLRRGVYRVKVDADLSGTLTLNVTQRFGHVQQSVEIRERQVAFDLVVPRDLIQFECVGYSNPPRTAIDLRSIAFYRKD